MRSALLTLLIALLFLGGCARMTSIYRDKDLPSAEAHVMLIDSKQRAVVSAPRGVELRVCAEPPPDVLSAMAASLSGQASRDEIASISASLAASLTENASAIERTQTINILRESMYRTCERYLSGAIGKTEFIVQSARDQRTMVAILAIEQLTAVQNTKPSADTPSAGGTVSDAVASRVVEIVRNMDAFDEVEMTCVVIFRLVADGAVKYDRANSDPLIKSCLERITAKTELDTATLKLETQDRTRAFLEGQSKVNEMLDQVAGKLGAGAALQILRSPPTPLDEYTADAVRSRLGGKSLEQWARSASSPKDDDDAEALLKMVLVLMKDRSADTLARWTAAMEALETANEQ